MHMMQFLHTSEPPSHRIAVYVCVLTVCICRTNMITLHQAIDICKLLLFLFFLLILPRCSLFLLLIHFLLPLRLLLLLSCIQLLHISMCILLTPPSSSLFMISTYCIIFYHSTLILTLNTRSCVISIVMTYCHCYYYYHHYLSLLYHVMLYYIKL